MSTLKLHVECSNKHVQQNTCFGTVIQIKVSFYEKESCLNQTLSYSFFNSICNINNIQRQKHFIIATNVHSLDLLQFEETLSSF